MLSHTLSPMDFALRSYRPALDNRLSMLLTKNSWFALAAAQQQAQTETVVGCVRSCRMDVEGIFPERQA